MSYVVPSPLVAEAGEVARFLLRHEPRRLAHVEAAARRAAAAARVLSTQVDGECAVAAARLHDIGYSADIRRTGFHPLDGALHLSRTGWPDDVVRLVAHHSESAMVAEFHGVGHHLALIPPVPGLAADVVTYADLTAGFDGAGATLRTRVADMRRRHAGNGVVPDDVRDARYEALLAAARRVRDAMEAELARPAPDPAPATGGP